MSYEYDGFAEYAALESERAKLAEQAQSASEFTREIFQAGVEKADERLSALREDPDFVAHATKLYAPVKQAYAELDGLRVAVSSGLIDPEMVTQARQTLAERIAGDPDLALPSAT